MQIETSELFKILSSELRLEILLLLEHGPLQVGDIVSAVDREQSTVSHQLNILLTAKLLKVSQDGIYRTYSLNHTEELVKVIKEISRL